MKIIGLIGGIGPESTLDYYKGIVDSLSMNDINAIVPDDLEIELFLDKLFNEIEL
jgi:aspartate/glutamate racemase